jgi:hypothetical protein
MLTKDCMLLHLPSYKEMTQLHTGSTVAVTQPVSVLCVCEDFLKVQGPSGHYQLHVHPLSSLCKSRLRIAIPSLPLYAFMFYTGTALALNLPLSVFTKFFVTESRFDCHNFIPTCFMLFLIFFYHLFHKKYHLLNLFKMVKKF